jgi:uncharacterized protein involved in response to NO
MAPYKPMFLAGAIWAVIAVIPVTWQGTIELFHSPLGNRFSWHGHEMVFGFAAAMFAGYTLTAMKGWSNSAHISGRGIILLLALWCLARLTAAGVFGTELVLVLPGSVAFLAYVTFSLACASLKTPSVKSLMYPIFALTLISFQIFVLWGANSPFVPVLGFAVLLSIVGSRMLAAFGLNWLNNASRNKRFKLAQICGYPSTLAILAALLLEVFIPETEWIVHFLLLAAVGEVIRLSLWICESTFKNRLLSMLSLAYAWLPLGLFLLALSALQDWILSNSAAWHALAAGAIACSIHAVSLRAVALRSDFLRPLLIDQISFGLLWVAALLRVFAPEDTLAGSTVPLFWFVAWTIFIARQSTNLLRPTPRPVFSGLKRSIDCE